MRLLPVFTAIALTGCAHTCQQETFFKSSIVSPATIKTGGNYRHLTVFADNAVMFRVFECGTAYRKSDLSPAMICIALQINEGAEISLVSPDFNFYTPSGSKLGVGRLKNSEQVFPGGREGFAPPLARVLVDSENRKRYLLTVQVPEISLKEFTMQTPELLLNGSPWTQYIFRFKQVTEDVCHVSV